MACANRYLIVVHAGPDFALNIVGREFALIRAQREATARHREVAVYPLDESGRPGTRLARIQPDGAMEVYFPEAPR